MKNMKNFSLAKVKLLNGGGLEAHYQEVNEKKGITDTKTFQVKDTINPHPDLIEKVNELKEYLSKCYGMDSMLVLAKSKGLDAKVKTAFKTCLEVIENVHSEQMKKINITGVSISGEIDGDKDKRSVVISGTMAQENGSKTALNSPNIKLNNDQFKFEGEVQDIVNSLTEEVQAYLFEGKKAQLEMNFEPKEGLSEDFKKGNISKVEDEKEAA